MFDRYLNSTPTFYKWDRFWIGALPALIVPFIGLAGLYLITFLNGKFNTGQHLSVVDFLISIRTGNAFIKVSTVCCMLNGLVFFFFVKKDYNNASRGVMIITMLWVFVILIKEMY